MEGSRKDTYELFLSVRSQEPLSGNNSYYGYSQTWFSASCHRDKPDGRSMSPTVSVTC